MNELGKSGRLFRVVGNSDRLHPSASKGMNTQTHTLSLKVLSPEILIVRSSEIRSRCLRLGWCLIHVGGMFANEEMPCLFLPFFGAICCGFHNTRPIPH